MKIFKFPNDSELSKICKRPTFSRGKLQDEVKEILETVRKTGDDALREYALRFDGVRLNSIAYQVKNPDVFQIGNSLTDAISTAIKNVKAFHTRQLRDNYVIETTKGVICERRILPLERAGIYIPGGNTPLFSSLIMQFVPASLAGVKEIVAFVAPNKDRVISTETLESAKLLGLKTFYVSGGAQAIGAMAFGTETVPKVDKIFGPGNQYVTEAKRQVQDLGTPIDMPAGPSEIAVLCDKESDPEFIAWDLLSQAEHGKDSQALLVSWDEAVVMSVRERVLNLLPTLPRAVEAAESMANSRFVIVNNVKEALKIVNAYAPEHLILACENSYEVLQGVTNAGSVFMGQYTPEVLGDYASGTNHVLPTGGFARTVSGLSVESFQKSITVQRAAPQGLKELGPRVALLAEAEGLFAHAEAVKVRLNKLGCLT